MLVINQADQEVALQGDLPVSCSVSSRRKRRRSMSHGGSVGLMLLATTGKQNPAVAHAALYVVLPAYSGRSRPSPAYNKPPPQSTPRPPPLRGHFLVMPAGLNTPLLTAGMQEECGHCRLQQKLSVLLLVHPFLPLFLHFVLAAVPVVGGATF